MTQDIDWWLFVHTSVGGSALTDIGRCAVILWKYDTSFEAWSCLAVDTLAGADLKGTIIRLLDEHGVLWTWQCILLLSPGYLDAV